MVLEELRAELVVAVLKVLAPVVAYGAADVTTWATARVVGLAMAVTADSEVVAAAEVVSADSEVAEITTLEEAEAEEELLDAAEMLNGKEYWKVVGSESSESLNP